jgi:hypothetical protein
MARAFVRVSTSRKPSDRLRDESDNALIHLIGENEVHLTNHLMLALLIPYTKTAKDLSAS